MLYFICALAAALTVSSNANGKALVRSSPGKIVAVSAAWRPVLPEDTNTVVHLVWNGVALVDLHGNAWTTNGTPPQVQRNGKTPAGAGPFSSTNNYKTTATSDAFDSSSTISACAIVKPADTTACRIIGANNASSNAGWSMWLETSLGHMESYGTGAAGLVTGNSMAVGSLNVICAGANGTSNVVKLNLGTYATGTSAALAPSTGSTFIGIYGDGTSQPCSGTICEVLVSTSAPSDALFTGIMQAAKARLGITAW